MGLNINNVSQSQIMLNVHNLSPASRLVFHLDKIGQNDCLGFSYMHTSIEVDTSMEAYAYIYVNIYRLFNIKERDCDNMKKIILGIIAAVIMCGCISCNNNATYTYHINNAYIEISSSSGVTTVCDMTSVKFITDENMSVHFHCDDCGHDESIEATAPMERIFNCECGNSIKAVFETEQ